MLVRVMRLGGPKPPVNPLARLIASTIEERQAHEASGDTLRAIRADVMRRKMRQFLALAQKFGYADTILVIHRALAQLPKSGYQRRGGVGRQVSTLRYRPEPPHQAA